jgi:hypothetical protein
MDQSVSLVPALLGFLSLGAALILQRAKDQPQRKLWLVSANDAYETRAFGEYYRIKREIGEDIKCFFLVDEAADGSAYCRIELPSGRRDTIIKESVEAALRKKVLVDFDPETRRRQQAKISAQRRARQTRGKGWPSAITKLVIEGKIKVDMTHEQVMVSWGKPEQITRSEGEWGVSEQWVYGSTYLYFERGVLHSYQERGVTRPGEFDRGSTNIDDQ